MTKVVPIHREENFKPEAVEKELTSDIARKICGCV
jgi:hypothetical protein